LTIGHHAVSFDYAYGGGNGREKGAVRAGGGSNHRFGLDDAVLIKDNHVAVAGGIRLMRQSILGVSSNGCLQAHPAAKPSIARKIIGASTRRACRVGVAMSRAGCMGLKPACSAMSTRSMGAGWPEDRPQKHSGRLEAVPSR